MHLKIDIFDTIRHAKCVQHTVLYVTQENPHFYTAEKSMAYPSYRQWAPQTKTHPGAPTVNKSI
jgi:hypothetical protein